MSANTSPAGIQLPTDEELVLKVIPMPADSNANGDIFGGWVTVSYTHLTLPTKRIV